MSAIWATVAGLAVATAAIKASGPLLLGGRALPSRFMGVIALMAPALLAALVVTETFAHDGRLTLDASAIGVGAAAVAIALRAGVVVVVLVAAVAAALARGVG